MAHPFSAIAQDDLNDIFLRGFREYIKGIVDNLSSEANDPATATAIKTVVAQLNYDYNRLVYIIDIIQDRVCQDAQWASAAVAVYDMTAMSLDLYHFSHPSLPLQGPLLVQHQLMKALQAQFNLMVAADTWIAAFTFFLAQLCRSRDSLGRFTPAIMLHIISKMVKSMQLFNNRQLGLLFEVINAAGPVLDTQALEVVDEFGMQLQQLQERVRGKRNVLSMAVFGLVRLRELGWNVEPSEST